MLGLGRLRALFDGAPREIDRFCTLIAASGLMAAGDIAGVRKDFAASLPYAAADRVGLAAFCQFLIECGALTAWQCGKLQEGRYKGFFIDRLKLLSVVGYSDMEMICLAENTPAKCRVHVHVLPAAWRGPPPSNDYRTFGEITYRVAQISE